LFDWQTIDVTETHYDDAIARLTKALSLILEKDTKAPVPTPPPKPDPPAPKPTPPRASLLWLIAAAVVGVAVLGALAFWSQTRLASTNPRTERPAPNAAAPSSSPAATPATPMPSPAPPAQASSNYTFKLDGDKFYAALNNPGRI
jgi:hypothetical protein